MFSSRLDADRDPDPLVALLHERVAEGHDVIDLTESNPTRVGLDLSELGLPGVLAHPLAVRHAPSPQGWRPAREAVVEYYHAHGRSVDVDHVLLTASTSEAYSFLFRLLCDPGDEVLVPSPGYPLFDYLAALDGVRQIAYPLRHRDRWHLHLERLEASVGPRTRALIVVSPHNPTGHVLSIDEREALVQLCARRGLALVVDEVFLDYVDPHAGTPAGSLADVTGALTFVLSGLSKVCAAPQIKLGWIVVQGPDDLATEALRRLEFVADTYLSVSAPAQLAAPSLLRGRHGVQRALRARLAQNLETVRHACEDHPRTRVIEGDGGWYVLVQVDGIDARRHALERLQHADVFAHPGAFYDLDDPTILVLGLLCDPERMRVGVERLLEPVG